MIFRQITGNRRGARFRSSGLVSGRGLNPKNMNERTLFPFVRLRLMAATALTGALLLTGCGGYRLGDVKPAAYANVNNLYVPTFENDTLEPRLSVLVTNAVISALQQDGTFKITTKEKSDAVLVGRIREIRRTQQRSTQTEVLKTREMLENLQIDFHLEDPLTGRTLSNVDAFGLESVNRLTSNGARVRTGNATGLTSVFLDRNFELSERQALSLAAQDAAEQIVSQLGEGW